MYYVRLLYLLTLIAPSCVAFTPPDSYPIMKLEELTGEERATALEFLDATLAKLANSSAFATNYSLTSQW
ncbi:uncharacterized protein LOC116805997 [Drosophila grimshawi]|uniref:uncharacterized protein LOC116805997 n=1 Tax=Drosophila grimshawi TaxID=7222 RepID=UPI000C87107C|nr:uncharacterized protein LOC116805997 [Drosophila grimshawi]